MVPAPPRRLSPQRPRGGPGLLPDGGCPVHRGREERRRSRHPGGRGRPRPRPPRGTSGAPSGAGSRPRRGCGARTMSHVAPSVRATMANAEPCRRGAIATSMVEGWSEAFLGAGRKRPAGGTARAGTSDEVRDLRREAGAPKEVLPDLALVNRPLEESLTGDGGTTHEVPCRREDRDHQAGRGVPPAGPPHAGEARHPEGHASHRWYEAHRTGGPEAPKDRPSRPSRVWNRIPDDARSKVIALALDQPEPSAREPAVRFT